MRQLKNPKDRTVLETIDDVLMDWGIAAIGWTAFISGYILTH